MSLRVALVIASFALPASAGILPVPKRGQQTTKWCWAACGEMLTAWHVQEGAVSIHETSQCTQADRRCPQIPNATCPCPECATGNACGLAVSLCATTGWTDLGYLGFTYKLHERSTGLSLRVIRQEIDHRRPFLFTTVGLTKDARGRLKDSGLSHMHVGVGYEDVEPGDDAKVRIHYINPKALNETCACDAAWMPFSDFETRPGELWRHVLDHYEIRPKAAGS